MTIKRKTPLRRAMLKRRNEARAEKRRAERFGEQADACRRMPCAVCLTRNAGPKPERVGDWLRGYLRADLLEGVAYFQTDPHHEPTRAAGGKDKDTVPLCREHHDERHRIGRKAFEEKHGVDLRAIAKAIHEEMRDGRRENTTD